LDALGLDEPHRAAIRIPIDVGIMELLPAIKLLIVNYNQQLRRLPIHVQIPFDVVSIPPIEPLPYTCWVPYWELVEFAGSAGDCHPLGSCAITGRQKVATIATLLLNVLAFAGILDLIIPGDPGV
jgi:hypothetical protein